MHVRQLQLPAHAGCQEEVAQALERQRKTSAYRATISTVNEKGPIKIEMEYVLPDRMHQTVKAVLEPGAVETILVGSRAWASDTSMVAQTRSLIRVGCRVAVMARVLRFLGRVSVVQSLVLTTALSLCLFFQRLFVWPRLGTGPRILVRDRDHIRAPALLRTQEAALPIRATGR